MQCESKTSGNRITLIQYLIMKTQKKC